MNELQLRSLSSVTWPTAAAAGLFFSASVLLFPQNVLHRVITRRFSSASLTFPLPGLQAFQGFPCRLALCPASLVEFPFDHSLLLSCLTSGRPVRLSGTPAEPAVTSIRARAVPPAKRPLGFSPPSSFRPQRKSPFLRLPGAPA